MCRPLIGRAAPRDHIRGHGPRRPGKSDQSGFARQFARQDADGFVNRVQNLVNVFDRAQLVEIGLGCDGRKPRPFAGHEPQIGAQRLWHQQNVSKQDRRIKPVTANGLQRHFGGQFRVVTQRQEIACLRPCRLVFRQVPPGLTHHPDRRCRQAFPGQGTQKCLLAHHRLRS